MCVVLGCSLILNYSLMISCVAHRESGKILQTLAGKRERARQLQIT
jgi:hypothetical protein